MSQSDTLIGAVSEWTEEKTTRETKIKQTSDQPYTDEEISRRNDHWLMQILVARQIPDIEEIFVVFWNKEKGFGKALDILGRVVFIHGNQFKVIEGDRWISAEPPDEISQHTRLLCVARHGPQDRQAARWTIAA